MKILLTDGSHGNTLAIVRHLKNHKISIIHHKKSAITYSKYCEKFIICPNIVNIEKYFKFLYNHVKANHYDILIPVGALASYVCSKYYDKLSSYIRIEIAKFKDFYIAINKVETYKFCEKYKILHPKTYYSLADIEYPAIVKSTGELKGKIPVEYIDDKYELVRGKYSELQREDLIVQEHIVGEPYGFFCLYQNGTLKKAICQRRIREYPPTGGHATSAETIYDPKLIELGKNVFDKLNWHGVGMVEYKKDVKGNYWLIEINPKFWTALELHILAGMHFPKYLLEMGTSKLEYYHLSGYLLH